MCVLLTAAKSTALVKESPLWVNERHFPLTLTVSDLLEFGDTLEVSDKKNLDREINLV